MPVYLDALKTGLLDERIKSAAQLLNACELCPRKCGSRRLAGETGVCKTADKAFVSSFSPHFGEEEPLVGQNGSGTIFFTHCNLMCNFCQNFDISHEGIGEEATDQTLAAVMLHLQAKGCHNINFVTPTHVMPMILSALKIAGTSGLNVPLVYNCGGYESVESLKLLDGIIDIYMPDFKFWDPEIGNITCGVKDYPQAARDAVMEMHRQVGDLTIDPKTGLASKGLLIRHLVMPGDFAGTKHVMGFIAEKISGNTYVNIMPQYRPCGNAWKIKELSTRLSRQDYDNAINVAKKMGITRLDER